MAKRSFSTASVSDVCPAMLMCAGLRAGNTGGGIAEQGNSVNGMNSEQGNVPDKGSVYIPEIKLIV